MAQNKLTPIEGDFGWDTDDIKVFPFRAGMITDNDISNNFYE